MKFNHILVSIALCQLEYGHSFQLPTKNSLSTTALFVKTRKTKKRRSIEKQSGGRPDKFYEAIEEAQGKKKGKKPGKTKPEPLDEEEARRQAITAEAQAKMESRPGLSTMVVDEETGIEVLSQGQSVVDVVTRKAVKLSDLGPEYRLAQMFPGVPPDIREKYRFDMTSVTVPEMVEKLKEACSVKLEDGTQGIPPFPSVSSKAIDFVTANRDYLGYRMKNTLGRLTMRAASQNNDKEAEEMDELWKHFMLLENHISAPFRQMIQTAEGRVGPNFGNLELMKYCDGDLYERVGNYIVLKGMVAHWEKKVVDASYVEQNPLTSENFMNVLGRGDPKRYLPDPPILFTVKECTQVCAMAQQMCEMFVGTEELFGDFPPEVVFLEEALKIKGGAALRKFMIDEFCPARGITPEGLREGMRRFHQQLVNMQIDPYADMTNKVQALYNAMAVGTDDVRDPYTEYLANRDPQGPGTFQTYTYNYDKQSMVRFLDSRYPSANELDWVGTPESNAEEEEKEEGFDLGNLFNLSGERRNKPLRMEPRVTDVEETYTVPEERAAGRPHQLDWFEKLNEKEFNPYRLGEVPAGRIIPDE